MASRHQTDTSFGKIERSNFDNIDLAISRLRASIDATRKLESEAIDFDDPKVDATQRNIRESVLEIFGAESPEYHDHSQHRIWHGSQIYLEARNKRQLKFNAGIPHTVIMLEGLIARLEDRRELLGNGFHTPVTKQESTPISKQSKSKISDIELSGLQRHLVTNRICVVHGHNDALKNAVSDYLKKRGLEPIVLHKTQDSDRNIIEKIESLPEVDFAVVLLTADDFTQPGMASQTGKPHMHRNVLFELGYYVGRLGKSRVCTLFKGQGKLPNDYNGVACLTIDDTPGWRRLLGLELKAAGFEINEAEE